MSLEPVATTAPARPLPRALGVVLCLLPLALALFSPVKADAGLFYVGLLPALVALTCSPRVAAGAAVATGLAVFVGLLLSATPWAGTAMMVLLGLGVARSYRYGWQGPMTYIATQGALAVVAAPRSVLVNADVLGTAPVAAAAVAAPVLAGGLWVALIGRLLLFDVPRADFEVPTERDLTVFALALCLTLGPATYAIMVLAPGSNAWWVLLTVLVVLQPDPDRTRQRGLARAGGTVLGGVVAALAVALFDSAVTFAVLGAAAALASALTYLRAPYWVFAACLTMALVLMMPSGGRLRGSLERVGFTLLAAAIAVLLSLAVQALARRLAPPSHTLA